jgi:tRNA U54 and U55 pseudouridine synthase Pus10
MLSLGDVSMNKTVNADNFPWSIKGVSIEARKMAKDGATKENLTIGQWLKIIIEAESDKASQPNAIPINTNISENIYNEAEPLDELDTSVVSDLEKTEFLKVFNKIETKFLDLTKPLQSILAQLSLRIESLENKIDSDKKINDQG